MKASASQVMFANLKAFVADFVQALRLLSTVEKMRRAQGPAPALKRLRQIGLSAQIRTRERRAILRRAIYVAELVLPSPPNCYRRVLLESAMDGEAARERVHI